MRKENLAKYCRQAGVKGMSESNGRVPIRNKVSYKSQYNVLPFLKNETLQEWKVRCKK